jgi:bifunctional DNA-binding transcriptional regulator/antitoxin component of YhaV-PrlF toxin-antitoxin module
MNRVAITYYDFTSMNSYKITTSGQFTLPAQIRRRWRAARVLVEDHGDHVVVRPVPENPITAVRGIFEGRMKTTVDEARAQAREGEREAEEAKHRHYYGE